MLGRWVPKHGVHHRALADLAGFADPTAAIDTCSVALGRARVAAHTLYRPIADVQIAINRIAYTGPDRE